MTREFARRHSRRFAPRTWRLSRKLRANSRVVRLDSGYSRDILDVRRRTVVLGLGIERDILDARTSAARHRRYQPFVCVFMFLISWRKRAETQCRLFGFRSIPTHSWPETPPVAPSINRTAESISCSPALFIVRATNGRRASAKKAGAAARSARTSQTERARRRAVFCLYVTCIYLTMCPRPRQREHWRCRSALRRLYAARACVSRASSARDARLLHDNLSHRKHSLPARYFSCTYVKSMLLTFNW